MKPLLTSAEQAAVQACVASAEAGSAAEIVPVIAPRSSDYPRAHLLGAFTLAMIAALPITVMFYGPSLWAFLGILALALIAAMGVLRICPFLLRFFVLQHDLEDAVELAAIVAFHRLRLRNTRDGTGMLLYVSLFERRVRLLVDDGISAAVDPEKWVQIVTELAKGLHSGNAGQAICRAVEQCGQIVTHHLPVRPGDTDELPNLVMLDESPSR